MLSHLIQEIDKQNKSQLIQRNDTLTIFPYIKSTNNYLTMCVGGYKQKTPLLSGADSSNMIRLTYSFPFLNNLFWDRIAEEFRL